MCPKAIPPTGFGERGPNHRGSDTTSARVRVHHQLGHRGSIRRLRGQIQIAKNLLSASVGDHQMLGAIVRKLTQYLLTHGCYRIEISCDSDEFTDLALLFGRQRRPPLRRRHWLCSGSASDSW